MRRELSGDDPNQRCLASSIGADERGLGAVADAERHVIEEDAAVRQLVPDSGDVDVTHEESSSPDHPWVATRFRPTTPAMIIPSEAAFSQFIDSPRNATPITATTAVPTPAQTAYA